MLYGTFWRNIRCEKLFHLVFLNMRGESEDVYIAEVLSKISSYKNRNLSYA